MGACFILEHGTIYTHSSNFFFKKVAKSGEQSANLNGSFTKLVTINFEDGTSENFLIMNNRIYSGVKTQIVKDLS